MDIVSALGTDERLRVLQQAYFSDNTHVMELATSTRLSKGFVSVQLAALAKQGIFRRKGNLFFPRHEPALRILLLRSVITDEFLRRHKATAGAFATVNGEQPYDVWTTSKAAAMEIERKLPGCKVLVSATPQHDTVVFGGGA